MSPWQRLDHLLVRHQHSPQVVAQAELVQCRVTR
jgi:hypothetical protein